METLSIVDTTLNSQSSRAITTKWNSHWFGIKYLHKPVVVAERCSVQSGLGHSPANTHVNTHYAFQCVKCDFEVKVSVIDFIDIGVVVV